MRLFILMIVLLNTALFAQAKVDIKKDERTQKNIKEQIEREKKYSIEQTFYKGKHYNLKEQEVSEETVKNIPDQRDTNADFDMNSTYD